MAPIIDRQNRELAELYLPGPVSEVYQRRGSDVVQVFGAAGIFVAADEGGVNVNQVSLFGLELPGTFTRIGQNFQAPDRFESNVSLYRDKGLKAVLSSSTPRFIRRYDVNKRTGAFTQTEVVNLPGPAATSINAHGVSSFALNGTTYTLLQIGGSGGNAIEPYRGNAYVGRQVLSGITVGLGAVVVGSTPYVFYPDEGIRNSVRVTTLNLATGALTLVATTPVFVQPNTSFLGLEAFAYKGAVYLVVSDTAGNLLIYSVNLATGAIARQSVTNLAALGRNISGVGATVA